MDFTFTSQQMLTHKALAIEPDSLSARRGLAEMKRSLGKADEAVTLYREDLAKEPENIPAQDGPDPCLYSTPKSERMPSRTR